MTGPKVNWEISVGTIIHALILLGGLAAGYGSISAQVTALGIVCHSTERNVQQVQHYLSGNDPQYWKKVNENGDADGR